MSERISDERLQYLTVHGFGALNLDDMLVFLKAEREEVERLQQCYGKAIRENTRKENRLNRLLERLQRRLDIEARDGNRWAEQCGETEARLNRLLERLNAFIADLHQMFPEAASTSREGWDIVCGVKRDLKAISAEVQKETPARDDEK